MESSLLDILEWVRGWLVLNPEWPRRGASYSNKGGRFYKGFSRSEEP